LRIVAVFVVRSTAGGGGGGCGGGIGCCERRGGGWTTRAKVRRWVFEDREGPGRDGKKIFFHSRETKRIY
jgi:hypothetical protein